LPAELYNIALRLGEKGLKSDAIKLHQYNADKFPKEAAAMRSQAQVVQLNIKDGNNAGAEAAYAKLLDTFKDRPSLPDEIVKVADAYLDANSFDKAVEVEQSVIAKWPKTTSAMNAQLGIVKVHFAKDDSSNADSALDTLIADYNDNKQLPQAILDTGEQYWKKGLDYSIEIGKQYTKSNSNNFVFSNLEDFIACRKAMAGGKAGEQYTKALAIWGKMLEKMPDSSMSDWANHLTAECYKACRDYTKALEYYRNILNKWPNFIHAWADQYRIAEVYDSMWMEGQLSREKTESAKAAAYENLLKKYPTCPVAINVQQWLKYYYEQLSY
jgi:TolA-binding protein